MPKGTFDLATATQLPDHTAARSIFAEYFLKQLRPDRFQVYGAGPHPRDKVDPLTLAILADQFAIKPEKAPSLRQASLIFATAKLVLINAFDETVRALLTR